VQSVSEEGGAVRTVLPAQEPRTPYWGPYFLPDDQHFLVYSGSADTTGELLIGDLKGTAPKRLLNTDSAAVYVSGHLLFVQDGTLYAQPFDHDRLALTGTRTAVTAQPIATGGGGVGIAAFSASSTGRVVFRSTETRRQFTWVDRAGTVISVVGDIDSRDALNPALSPDGKQLAYNRRIDTNTDVWVLDVALGSKRPLTNHPGLDHQPVWSPDGRHVVFSSIRKPAGYDLYEISVDAAEPETLVKAEPPGVKVATDWSRDDFVLYRTLNSETGYDVWAVSMRGDRKAFQVLGTTANERDAQFSPDGKWIAYESDKTGQTEIYIQAFPKASRVFGPVSKGGGFQARWRSDGKELYYISADRHLTAVKVNADAATGTVDYQPPSLLFLAPVSIEPSRQQYVVAKDGQRFLLNVELDRDRPYPMTLILNWKGITKP
jgi:dipeptidyl aminopeptidase/acylaminoacyl peptidase